MSKVANPVADLADKMDDVQIGKVTMEGNSIASPEKIVKHLLQVFEPLRNLSKILYFDNLWYMYMHVLIKLNFQNAWTLWFFKNDKSRTWEDNKRPIITGKVV